MRWVNGACEHCDGEHQRHRVDPTDRYGHRWNWWGENHYTYGHVCSSCKKILDQWDRESAKEEAA